jgi:hypothetical protein
MLTTKAANNILRKNVGARNVKLKFGMVGKIKQTFRKSPEKFQPQITLQICSVTIKFLVNRLTLYIA